MAHHPYHKHVDEKRHVVHRHETHIHLGTHPAATSKHSGNTVSNPNVVHHNAVHDIHGGHKSYLHHQKGKTHNKLNHNPNILPTSPTTSNPTGSTTAKPTPPKTPPKGPAQPATKAAHGPFHYPSSPSTNITPYNPASPAAIQKQIDDGKNAASNYKKQTQTNSGGSVTTPQVYDYSKNWQARGGGSFNQPYPGDNGSFVSNVNKWFSDTVQNVRNWIFPGNPYY